MSNIINTNTIGNFLMHNTALISNNDGNIIDISVPAYVNKYRTGDQDAPIAEYLDNCGVSVRRKIRLSEAVAGFCGHFDEMVATRKGIAIKPYIQIKPGSNGTYSVDIGYVRYNPDTINVAYTPVQEVILRDDFCTMLNGVDVIMTVMRQIIMNIGQLLSIDDAIQQVMVDKSCSKEWFYSQMVLGRYLDEALTGLFPDDNYHLVRLADFTGDFREIWNTVEKDRYWCTVERYAASA